MFCFRYRKMLMPYSEGALPQGSTERLERHLQSCAGCSGELAAITVTAGALRRTDIPAMEPAADLWARVRGELQSEPAPKPVWRVRSFQAASAAVVGAVLLLFVATRSPYVPIEQSSRPEVKATQKAGTNRTLASTPTRTDGRVKLAGLPESTLGKPAVAPSEARRTPAAAGSPVSEYQTVERIQPSPDDRLSVREAPAAGNRLSTDRPQAPPRYRIASAPSAPAREAGGKKLDSVESYTVGSSSISAKLGDAARPPAPSDSVAADIRAIDIDNSIIVRDDE
jgi:anti-sigma factor RsiW